MISMRKFVTATALIGTTIFLSACGSSSLFNRQRPDEFAVTRASPLVVPPDFALVPPAPGAAPSASVDSSKEAMQALFGTAQRSPTANDVLTRSGNADPGIRSDVADPATHVVDKGETTRDIIAAPEGDGQNARAATPQ